MKQTEVRAREESEFERKLRDMPYELRECLVRDLLVDMANPNSQEQAHRRFERLCELVGEVYPRHRKLSDAEIQANPVTTLLTRYLLNALQKYSDDIAKGEDVDTTKRRKFLANAFGVENARHGGNTLGKRWTEDLKLRVGQRFHSALYEAIERSGRSDQDAWIFAFEETYRYLYPEPDGGRDDRQTFKNQQELAIELAQMGYDLRHFREDA